MDIIEKIEKIIEVEKSDNLKLRKETSSYNEKKIEADFKKYCNKYGLTIDMLGKQFALNDNYYKIIGLNVKNKQHPILCSRSWDGKIYKFSPEVIKMKVKLESYYGK